MSTEANGLFSSEWMLPWVNASVVALPFFHYLNKKKNTVTIFSEERNMTYARCQIL
jgi:hypothetical protein